MQSVFYSRSHDSVIQVFDAAGNVIETHEHAGDLRAVSGRNKKPPTRRSVTVPYERGLTGSRCFTNC